MRIVQNIQKKGLALDFGCISLLYLVVYVLVSESPIFIHRMKFLVV